MDLIPVKIPPTTPTRYISFTDALNLRLPGEDTGDWHFLTAFFQTPDSPTWTITLAGEGLDVDSTPSLGTRGIRDMSDILARKRVLKKNGPVYVADHYRAITDLAVSEILKKRYPTVATPETINQWLDTGEQISILRDSYLKPLRRQFDGSALEIFDQWLPSVRYHQ